MVALPRGELERLGVSAATWEALEETARVRDRRARRRHFKRIANLLEREDPAAVQALLGQRAEQARLATARHQELEHWRERLLTEGDAALTELLKDYPDMDRQRLRQLVRAAQRDQARARPDGARKLFRFLREGLEQAGP